MRPNVHHDAAGRGFHGSIIHPEFQRSMWSRGIKIDQTIALSSMTSPLLPR